MPRPVVRDMGMAISAAQMGGKSPSAKPWRGEGPGAPRGIKTAKTDVDLIRDRLHWARQDYRQRYGKEAK